MSIKSINVKKGWETRRKNGTTIPWNKGLSKETDERVAKYAKSASDNHKNTHPREVYEKSIKTRKENDKNDLMYKKIAEIRHKNNTYTSWCKGLTKETDERLKKISDESHFRKTKNKTYEEIYGVEKAEEMKSKCSSRMSGKNNHMYGRSPIYHKHSYKNYDMKSSWEIAYAKYLDENNISWEYEEKRFNLGRYTYAPDFFIYDENNNLKEIIEIKGYENKKFIEKFKLFEQLYPNEFKITKLLKEKDLIELKILK